MQLRHIIHLNSVCIDPVAINKTAVFLKVSQLLSQTSNCLDKQALFDAYCQRERLGSTAIGQGISIPHIRSSQVTRAKACVIRLLHPVDFNAEDKQLVDLVIGLVVPQKLNQQHLQLLSDIVKQFGEPLFRETCRQADTQEDFYRLLTQMD